MSFKIGDYVYNTKIKRIGRIEVTDGLPIQVMVLVSSTQLTETWAVRDLQYYFLQNSYLVYIDGLRYEPSIRDNLSDKNLIKGIINS